MGTQIRGGPCLSYQVIIGVIIRIRLTAKKPRPRVPAGVAR